MKLILNMCCRVLLVLFCLQLSGLPARAQHYPDQPLSFAAVKRIALLNLAGKKTYIQSPEVPLRLFVLLSPECPLCKNYSLVLNALSAKYQNNLQVYGLVPGKTYSTKELKQFARDYKIDFPLLIDAEKRFTHYLKATVTPEVVLADSSGFIVYRGAIDDWVEELGKKKTAPQQHYLQDAIAQYLEGSTIKIKTVPPKGCLINEF